jgi:DNA-binding CsgD family transcriptional regulator
MSTQTAPLRERSDSEAQAFARPQLKPQEIAVLQMAADGESCKSTAARMGRVVGYVKNLRQMASLKLGADGTTHAVAQALRRGIIN